MKSSARLDSAIFQLTPTRTRCDLIITANGKTEKIASGLLNPFLAHLKTAQAQIAKGGYSILLEPGSDTTWFTKGTVERFVRFVSTPEILERVHTIESEILQIEKAIAIQGNNDMGLSTEEDCQPKPVGNIEGSKIITDANEEKAIVLYKPDVHPPEANGSRPQEGNSKVQLLKVLETRKTVLQKEQGMAFARAAAAGFDIDEITSLVSFSECFGASRLMDACLRFMDLWKGKHETGQWLEIEAAEAMSGQSEFSAMNASGIMLSSVANKQNGPHGDLAAENIGKAGIDTSTDERHPMDHQVPAGQQEYFQGQFPHPMFPPWPAHYPPGAFPVFPQYPVQVPYYQNYPGNGPFYQPPYPPTEDSQLNVARRAGRRRNSADGGDGNTESEEQGGLELEKEASPSRGPRKKAGKSSKKQSGVVVIRNINYIASKGQNSSGSESQSASDSEIDKESRDLQASAPEMIQKNSLSSKRAGSHTKFMDESNSYDKVETVSGKGADGENWQAFQNFLLKDTDEHNHGADQDMFVSEKNVQIKRQQNALGGDPLAFGGQNLVQEQDARITEFHKISGNATRMLRPSNDEVLLSRWEGDYGNGRGSADDQMDLQFTELNERKVLRRRNENDDCMIVGRENQSHLVSSADPLAVNGFMHATNNFGRSSQQDMTDESFIVPFRSISVDQVGPNGRTVIDMDSEFPSTDQKSENSSNRMGNQVNYEPDDLSLMPERGLEKRTVGYDPALEYKTPIHTGDAAALDNRNKVVVGDVTQGPKKSNKDRKSKVAPDALDKKKTVGPIRKGKPSKMSPLDDARARAERLRTYKADLQKMKKEKEEEALKRLEALKIERQKRIAARGGSNTAQSPSSQQTRKQLPTKLSPSSQRGSRFSDLEPGSSSPLQRSKLRTASLGSSESQKASKTSKSSNVSHLPGNRLIRSVSSLPERRKESSGDTPNAKASMARIRRLSEPKSSSSPYVAPMKMRSSELLSKPKVSNEPESKKIAAIINLDKSKAATLPELKIRTSKGPSDVGRNKSAAKETSHKVNGKKSFVSSGSNNDKNTHQSDLDDNPVIDKTVVMLECEKPSVPVLHESEESIGVQRENFDNQGEIKNTEMMSGYAAIRAPASSMDRVDIEPVRCQLQEQSRSYVVNTSSSHAEKESLESSKICTDEKPYQAPYARLSSLEDPCTENSEYGKAPSMGLDTTTMNVETAKTQVSGYENLKLEKIPEVLEKPQVKESTKGFKRLLKFGRKNHSSAAGDRSLESDNGSVNGSEVDDSSTNVASASEVHTLKNLISQDETPIAGTASQKSSRHFSLLSPFRSKTSEKKLTT